MPEITGTSTLPSIDKVRDRHVMDTRLSGSMCVVRITHYRHGEDEPYSKDVLVLYTSQLDELCRWWSEVKKAVK